MTDQEVLEALGEHVNDDVLAQFAVLQMNYDVTNGSLAPGRHLFAPVQCPDGRWMAAEFSLEAFEDEDGGYWETTWHAVHGPVTLDELKALAAA